MAAFALDALNQCFFLPKPTLTEANLPSQSGRVFIVTGGYTGVGKELAKILYQHSGTVYLAGRSSDKGDAAIADIKQLYPSSDGRLEFLKLDLSDLTTIKASADAFLQREQRLDVLTNNAGVMNPPPGSMTANGHELQIGTNCLGPWLFTHYLTPLLKKTAASSPKGSVRVTWAASLGTAFSPNEGVTWDADTGGVKNHTARGFNYLQTKACNVFLAREYDALHRKDGIVSNAWNPGNLASELQRHGSLMEWLFLKVLLFPPHLGGYTELWAGWSEEAGRDENAGKYIGPWGRFVLLRGDVEKSSQSKKVWDWCEKECAKFAEL